MLTRKMKDSGIEWIGEIPEDWEVKLVKHEFYRKKNTPASMDFNILSLARSGIKIRDISTGEGQIAQDYSNYNPVSPGDLLLNPMDLMSGDNCNISYVTGVISQAYFNLGTIDSANPYYFNYYFKLQYWLGAFFAHGKGVSFENRWTINNDTLMNYPITFPTIKEQCRIACKLDFLTEKISDLKQQTEQSIKELKKYKQSLITEAVTKGLDPNVEMKDSGIEWIGEIPKHWSVRKISNYFSQVKDKNDELEEENLLSLSYGSIIRRNINSTDGLLPANFKNYNIVESGDIVLRMTDLQNDKVSLRTGFVTEKGIITSAYITIRTDHKNVILPKYIRLFLHSFDIYKGFYGMGSGVRQNVTYNDIKKIEVIVPSINEQRQIVSYLDEQTSRIDKLIADKTKVIKELEDYKKSLIYEYVTGKKEV